jgi:ribosomal protein S18 acetylase RimI-like enzyme
MMMTTAYEIRPVTNDDHGPCRDLWLASEGLGDVPDAADFARFLARNPGLSHLAHAEDGAVAGVVLASFDGIRGYLYRMAVASSWRRRGIAAALVRRCAGALHEQGATRINIHVFAANAAALAFWSALGWTAYDDLLTLRAALPLASSPPGTDGYGPPTSASQRGS